MSSDRPGALTALALLPFIPSGKDPAASGRLFVDLGFEKIREGEGYATFRSGEVRFILQTFDDPVFASNLMMRLDVADLDLWWQQIEGRQLEQRYPGVKIRPPTDFPWGREVHLIDLAGVCWHIGVRGT